MTGLLLAAVIQLTGVVGDSLRTRAFFDANNVKVGDPLVLTIDFIGKADFEALHPPRLSRHVSGKDWKLDDASAKTLTVPNARRLVYRVRPMRKGLLYFPAFEFGYETSSGEKRTVRSNEIPVHAKTGAQVVVAEMEALDASSSMPQPDGLIVDAAVRLGDDESFAWRKACATPTADAFARFDFPAARLNEARQAILEGNWARALRLYQALEWKIGQTPQIERGILAALALKYDNPSVELPVWRQVGRPLLKYDWKIRLGAVLAAIAVLYLLFRLAGRLLKAIACLSVAVMLPLSADAFLDPFESLEKMMRQSMRGSMSRMGFTTDEDMQGGNVAVEMSAAFSVNRDEIQVGDEFEYIIELEVPKNLAIGNIGISVSPHQGMKQTGACENYPDREPENPSNTVKRISIPVRYDVPFCGNVSFTLDVPYSLERRISRGGFSFSSSIRRSEKVVTPPVKINIKPLPSAGKPAVFTGIVSEEIRFTESLDIVQVETNDVVQLTYELRLKGHLPEDFNIPAAAFEIDRSANARSGETVASWRRYFVADGTPATPLLSIDYYDVNAKKYKKVKAGGARLEYVSGAESEK
jgi:hypothetical protein